MSLWIQTATGTLIRADGFDTFSVRSADRVYELVATSPTHEVVISTGPDPERLRLRLQGLAQILIDKGQRLAMFSERDERVEVPHDDPDAGHKAD